MDETFWHPDVIEALTPLFQLIESLLEPINGKQLLVHPGRPEELPFRLAARVGNGHVTALAPGKGRDRDLRRRAERERLTSRLTFKHLSAWTSGRMPLKDGTMDAYIRLDSVFFLSECGYGDWPPTDDVDVLRPGGVFVDLITRRLRNISKDAELAFSSLDISIEDWDTPEEVRSFLEDAGLVEVSVQDVTGLFKPAWEACRRHARFEEDVASLAYVLDNPATRLGTGFMYILRSGRRPRT